MLSAVSGLKVAAPGMQQGEIVGVAIVVLVLLFSVQYLGTAKISAAFAPIVAVWLLFNAAIGFYNLSTCGWGIWQVGGQRPGSQGAADVGNIYTAQQQQEQQQPLVGPARSNRRPPSKT